MCSAIRPIWLQPSLARLARLASLLASCILLLACGEEDLPPTNDPLPGRPTTRDVRLVSGPDPAAGWQLYDNIRLRFNASVSLDPTAPVQLLILQPRQQTMPSATRWREIDYDSVYVPAAEVIQISPTEIEIPSNQSYCLGPDRRLDCQISNLRWATEYTIETDQLLVDGQGRVVDTDIRFHTRPPLPVLQPVPGYRPNQRVLPVHIADHSLLVRTMPDFYNLTADVLALQGMGQSIAVYDEGILNASEVSAAVAFRTFIGDDRYFPFRQPPQLATDPTSVSSHGTQMARYILNFAPQVALYDFPFAIPSHLRPWIASTLANYNIHSNLPATIHFEEYLQLTSQLNLPIFSHSGSVLALSSRQADAMHSAIGSGMIYSKSLGNTKNLDNRIDNRRCAARQNFLPYFRNLDNASGAFVTLQALQLQQVGQGSNRRYLLFHNHSADVDLIDSQRYATRSLAGDAAPYTLTVFENGNGATSEAAATFSAMMALVLEANRTYAANMTARQLVEVVFETATDLIRGPGVVDPVFGRGLVNLGKAVQQIKEGRKPSFRLYQDLNTISRPFDLSIEGETCTR